jgi:hypothetical protein
MMACKDGSDRETLKRREVDAAQLGFKPIYCLKLRADVHEGPIGASSESRVSRTTDESHSRNLVTTTGSYAVAPWLISIRNSMPAVSNALTEQGVELSEELLIRIEVARMGHQVEQPCAPTASMLRGRDLLVNFPACVQTIATGVSIAVSCHRYAPTTRVPTRGLSV